MVVLALGSCFILFYHQLIDGIILPHSRCWESPYISFGSLWILGLDSLGSQLGLRIKVSWKVTSFYIIFIWFFFSDWVRETFSWCSSWSKLGSTQNHNKFPICWMELLRKSNVMKSANGIAYISIPISEKSLERHMDCPCLEVKNQHHVNFFPTVDVIWVFSIL